MIYERQALLLRRDGPAIPDDPPAEPDNPPFDWRVVAPIRRAARAPDPAWWQGIARMGAPTLWISGGPASHIDPARIAAAAATMPAATVAEIPVGHLVHEEAPGEFARLVLPFLNG